MECHGRWVLIYVERTCTSPKPSPNHTLANDFMPSLMAQFTLWSVGAPLFSVRWENGVIPPSGDPCEVPSLSNQTVPPLMVNILWGGSRRPGSTSTARTAALIGSKTWHSHLARACTRTGVLAISLLFAWCLWAVFWAGSAFGKIHVLAPAAHWLHAPAWTLKPASQRTNRVLYRWKLSHRRMEGVRVSLQLENTNSWGESQAFNRVSMRSAFNVCIRSHPRLASTKRPTREIGDAGASGGSCGRRGRGGSPGRERPPRLQRQRANGNQDTAGGAWPGCSISPRYLAVTRLCVFTQVLRRGWNSDINCLPEETCDVFTMGWNSDLKEKFHSEENWRKQKQTQ